MSRESRFTPEQRFEIVLAVLEGRRPIAEICRDHQVTTPLVYRWEEEFLSGALDAVRTSLRGRRRELPIPICCLAAASLGRRRRSGRAPAT